MFSRMIEKAFRKAVYTRADDNGSIFYFSSDDFEGLHKKEYTVKSVKGHLLKGYFYFYDGYEENRLIIFEHGMGSGHRGYMKEIELICREGYLVFSYDHTGCMESGGDTTGGFLHSLIDLNDVICAIKNDDTYRSLQISVVGHSWGGFSALNISALHPEIKHSVGIAGFSSVKRITDQFFSGMLSFAGNRILKNIIADDPDFARFDVHETLQTTNTRVLYIMSDDDPTVSCDIHFMPVQNSVKRDNIKFLKVSGKRHNPNYTEDAVKYKDAFFAEYTHALKKKQLETPDLRQAFKEKYDWNRMTAQDMCVWKEIFDFLKS